MIDSIRTWRLLRELRAGARRSPASLERLQERLLRDAVRHAFDTIPFYRRFWREAGFDPGTFRGLADLTRLPIVTPALARSAIRDDELRSEAMPGEPRGDFFTSGSSGEPLRIGRGPVERRLWRALGLRFLLEHGFRWRDTVVHLDSQPSPTHPLQWLGISGTRWISPRLPREEQFAALQRAAPDLVVGTPTALRRVARALGESRRAVGKPRLAFCQGEALDGETRALLADAIGEPPVNVYGLTEVGYVAWQCEARAAFHINADTCLVEVLRDGVPAPPGALGRLVVTDLRGRAMPLLRYDTGDLAVAADRACDCGRRLPCLVSIEGRLADAVALAGGRVATSRSIVDGMVGALRLGEYRIRQEAPRRFRLELANEAPREPVALRDRVRELLGDVEVSVHVVSPWSGGDEEKTRTVFPSDAPTI